MESATLQYVATDPAGVQPAIVHFTNGNVSTESNNLKFTFYKDTVHDDERSKQRKILIAESGDMKYTGQNYGTQARSSTMCKYLVGAYNEKTGVMKIYDSHLFKMQPKILDTMAAEEEEKDQLTSSEMNALLIESFGSSKKKKAALSRKNNKIDGGSLDDSLLQAMGQVAESPSKQGDQSVSSLLPPFNVQAETPFGVYSIEDIISAKEYDCLQSEAQEVIDCNKETISEWASKQRYPSFALQRMLVMPIDPELRRKRACHLLYLSYMIQLCQQRARDLRKKDVLSWIPESIRKKLCGQFTLTKERTFPTRLKDMLINYILVLALILDEFTLKYSPLTRDLKIKETKLKTHLQVVGCVFEKSKDGIKRKLIEDEQETKSVSENVAVLKIPLPTYFPNGPPVAGPRGRR